MTNADAVWYIILILFGAIGIGIIIVFSWLVWSEVKKYKEYKKK